MVVYMNCKLSEGVVVHRAEACFGPTNSCLASYPGFLTPAFVACSTNAGEGLVKLSHVV